VCVRVRVRVLALLLARSPWALVAKGGGEHGNGHGVIEDFEENSRSVSRTIAILMMLGSGGPSDHPSS
jgi:hypothetical protein